METPEKPKNMENQQPGYETRDVNVRSFFKYAIAIIAIALFAHVSMWLLFDVFAREAKHRDPTLSPLSPRQMQLPPQPRLQAEVVGDDRQNQPFDSLVLRTDVVAAEEELLKSYGWVNQNAGIVRIPIDQAMKLIVEKNRNTNVPQK
jgi:hypothetical protein